MKISQFRYVHMDVFQLKEIHLFKDNLANFYPQCLQIIQVHLFFNSSLFFVVVIFFQIFHFFLGLPFFLLSTGVLQTMLFTVLRSFILSKSLSHCSLLYVFLACCKARIFHYWFVLQIPCPFLPPNILHNIFRSHISILFSTP